MTEIFYVLIAIPLSFPGSVHPVCIFHTWSVGVFVGLQWFILSLSAGLVVFLCLDKSFPVPVTSLLLAIIFAVKCLDKVGHFQISLWPFFFFAVLDCTVWSRCHPSFYLPLQPAPYHCAVPGKMECSRATRLILRNKEIWICEQEKYTFVLIRAIDII